MNEVIKKFKDRTGHIYEIGDKYPIKGKVAKDRISELIGVDNKYQTPFIKEVKTEKQE